MKLFAAILAFFINVLVSHARLCVERVIGLGMPTMPTYKARDVTPILQIVLHRNGEYVRTILLVFDARLWLPPLNEYNLSEAVWV